MNTSNTSRMQDSTKLLFIKLLKIFEESLDSIVIITRAFGISNVIHTGKFYENIKSEPYINHALRVALIMAGELNIKDKYVISAAILHDIYDKTYANKFENNLEKILEEQSLNLVLSSIKYDVKGIGSKDHKSLSKISKTLRFLILADRLDNIRTLKHSAHKEKVNRYKEETQKYFLPIANITDDSMVFKLSVALYELK
ncbi:MAG: HD domain-containing protein [Nitrososphaeraceae archaeon]